MKTMWTVLLVLLSITVAISVSSCQGRCGAITPSGCWCDVFCMANGDCCPDKVAVCSGNNTKAVFYPLNSNDFAANPNAPVVPVQTCTTTPVDYYTMIYTIATLDGTTDDCNKACCQTPSCAGFKWLKSADPFKPATCSLHSQILKEQAVQGGLYVSYLKASAVSTPPPTPQVAGQCIATAKPSWSVNIFTLGESTGTLYDCIQTCCDIGSTCDGFSRPTTAANHTVASCYFKSNLNFTQAHIFNNEFVTWLVGKNPNPPTPTPPPTPPTPKPNKIFTQVTVNGNPMVGYGAYGTPITPTPANIGASCLGVCGFSSSSAAGVCYCDSTCKITKDCCYDKENWCPSPYTPPTPQQYFQGVASLPSFTGAVPLNNYAYANSYANIYG